MDNIKLKLPALLLLLSSAGASAETEIFRCPQDDGTIAFQEMPCAEPAEEAETESPEPEPEAVFEEPVSQIPVNDPLPTPTSEDRSECEKTARDAIDAIDLEIRASGYSREELENFKAELRVLTRQLRACKVL